MEEQYGKLSIEELEDVFWQRKNENETLYSVDNEFSLFPDDLKTLNLNRFTVKESLIHHVCLAPFVFISIHEIFFIRKILFFSQFKL